MKFLGEVKWYVWVVLVVAVVAVFGVWWYSRMGVTVKVGTGGVVTMDTDKLVQKQVNENAYGLPALQGPGAGTLDTWVPIN